MISTNDKDFYNLLISLRSHGWLRDIKDLTNWKKFINFYDRRFVFVDTGYNLEQLNYRPLLDYYN